MESGSQLGLSDGVEKQLTVGNGDSLNGSQDLTTNMRREETPESPAGNYGEQILDMEISDPTTGPGSTPLQHNHCHPYLKYTTPQNVLPVPAQRGVMYRLSEASENELSSGEISRQQTEKSE